MPKTKSPFTRRSFLKTSLAAAAGAASLPIKTYAFTPPPRATYIRYNVMSEGGQRAIDSYIKGIQNMLSLPATHPHNWFRNAFIHLMDCPHGNWWFYVWHRGYLGYFEETIRSLSNDSTFAMPYWDWTVQPQIPADMFNSVLTPTDVAGYERYTKTLDVFTAFIKPSLEAYFSSLNQLQRSQLNTRGYGTFNDLWNDVTGNGDPGNMGFATTANARWITSSQPQLDPETTYDCSQDVILAGLSPVDYYNEHLALSFTSKKTTSHMAPPERGSFSMLEALPHNNVHNNIGGVPALNPGPYGNMTNFLSPVDPIFFLHHSNMDRLWDVWTQKQVRNGQPILPSGPDLQQLSEEPFLFYVDRFGKHVGHSLAGEYLSTTRFDYEYEPGFGSDILQTSKVVRQKRGTTQVRGVVKGNRATLTVPSAAVKEHLTSGTLVAEVTVPHPTNGSQPRTFRVLVGAPEGVTNVDAKSPFFAGTIAFFGGMSHGHGTPGYATFAVPLPKAAQAFKGLAATNATVDIRIVPAYGQAPRTPLLKAATIRAL